MITEVINVYWLYSPYFSTLNNQVRLHIFTARYWFSYTPEELNEKALNPTMTRDLANGPADYMKILRHSRRVTAINPASCTLIGL